MLLISVSSLYKIDEVETHLIGYHKGSMYKVSESPYAGINIFRIDDFFFVIKRDGPFGSFVSRTGANRFVIVCYAQHGDSSVVCRVELGQVLKIKIKV